jgi:curved DNA-binding protein CbpA
MQDDLLRAALDGYNLAPGAGWSEILARYRHLAKVWHPDKFRSSEDKKIAEEKLKQIIAAKDLLQAHYHSGNHRPHDWCICWGIAPNHCSQNSQEGASAHSSFGQSQEPPGQKPKQPDVSPPFSSSTKSSTEPSSGPSSPPPPPPSSPPPPPPTSPSPPPSSAGDGNKDERRKADPHTKDGPWDWRNELSQAFDLGPITEGEPAWAETFRRMSERNLGKHPGDTMLDVWDKPPSWTKENKRKSLLIAFFTIMLLDKVITFIDPNAFKAKEPNNTEDPEINRILKPTLPRSPFAPVGQPERGTPVDLDSPEEIRKEQQYFEQKWREKEEMLHNIRSASQP